MRQVAALAVKIRKTSDNASKSRGLVTQVKASSSSPSWRFQPGKSGNPRGRPPGVPNHGHLRLHALLTENAEAVIHRVVQEALDGDMYAARLIMDRVLPRRICRPPMGLNLTALRTAADASTVLAEVVRGVADGLMTSAEAADIAKIVEAFNGALMLLEMAAKIESMDARLDEYGR